MQRRVFRRVQRIDRTVRRRVEQQIGESDGFVVYGGQMEKCLVSDRHGVRVARAVADVWRPYLNGASDLSFVTFGSSLA